jgi:hypothetical protein
MASLNALRDEKNNGSDNDNDDEEEDNDDIDDGNIMETSKCQTIDVDDGKPFF